MPWPNQIWPNQEWPNQTPSTTRSAVHSVDACVIVTASHSHSVDAWVTGGLVPVQNLSKDIIINPIKVLLPGQTFADETNIEALSLTFTPTGGNFSISVIQNAVGTPGEDFIIALPFGRLGVVKGTRKGFSTGGLLDIITGPIQPLGLTQQIFLGVPGNVIRDAASVATQLAQGIGINWRTLNVLVKNFIFRGITLAGLQQLARLVLADIFVRADGVYIVDPGAIIGTIFSVQKSDIVSVAQAVDYSRDIASVLNPAITSAQLDSEGDFVYDSAHAQKQPQFTVQAGAPGATGSSDFIPIPDGWMIDGTFEEWTPTSSTDLTNPSPSVPNGRYWKVIPSPVNPGMMRGITGFSRIVKPITIPGNVSSFVASPITQQASLQASVAGLALQFQSPGTQGGMFGFDALDISLFDVLSGQFVTIPNAITLVPSTGFAGIPNAQFYTIQMELWTFPRVNPQSFPSGGPDPTNPFNIPANVVVVTPSSNVTALDSVGLQTYYNKYLQNHRLINSPRLTTTISVLYRNVLPQVGDELFVVAGVPVNNCGRIESVSLNFGRGGIVLSVTATAYNSTGGSGSLSFPGGG